MFRLTNVLLDQCSVDESALDKSVADESTPTRQQTFFWLPDNMCDDLPAASNSEDENKIRKAESRPEHRRKKILKSSNKFLSAKTSILLLGSSLLLVVQLFSGCQGRKRAYFSCGKLGHWSIACPKSVDDFNKIEGWQNKLV